MFTYEFKIQHQYIAVLRSTRVQLPLYEQVFYIQGFSLILKKEKELCYLLH